MNSTPITSTCNLNLSGQPIGGATPRRHRWGQLALRWSDVAVYLAAWTGVVALGPRNSIWLSGLAFSMAGFAAWMVARFQLGSAFSIRAEARELVATGLFRWFSHPIYFSGALAHLGAVIALQQWWLVPLWSGLPLALQWERMKREDAVLAAEFGDEFRRLRQRVLF